MSLLSQLYRNHFISPKGLFTLFSGNAIHGNNLMVMLRFAARYYPHQKAVTDEEQSISYGDLYKNCRELSATLYHHHALKPGEKCAVLCRNHSEMVKLIFSLSATGTHVFLLNPDMSPDQFSKLHQQHRFTVVFCDRELEHVVNGFEKTIIVPVPVITNLVKIPRQKAGQLIVLTSGTSGNFKTAGRKPKARSFIRPFLALLQNIQPDRHHSIYIATPLAHGFGLAALCMSIALGKHIFLLKKFDTSAATKLVSENKIEILSLVPLMLKRLMNENTAALQHVQCFISGGAPLDNLLVQEIQECCGHKLYNLYGTSEAGFVIMAQPQDLQKAPGITGKPIRGVKVSICNIHEQPVNNGETGQLFIKAKWSVNAKAWIATGDLARMDNNGYLYLMGRVDNMIVSAGQNVYPVELENILRQHPLVNHVFATGIQDNDFGQRLKIYVELKEKKITDVELMQWIKTKAARYQVPKEIVLVEQLPFNSIGKINRQSLEKQSAK